jgi:hypothetical protein
VYNVYRLNKHTNGRQKMNGEVTKVKRFDDYSDAFDYCRDSNRPVKVRVGNEIAKLFPSGRAEIIGEVIGDDEYSRAQQRWQECTCRPQDALLCPSCLEYNRRKYGENIAFFSNGKEVVE